MQAITHHPYPTDASDEEWASVVAGRLYRRRAERGERPAFLRRGAAGGDSPRNRDAAKAVLRHASAHQRLEGHAGDAILENLIG